MKNFFKSLSIILCFLFVLPVTAFAQDAQEEATVQEEFSAVTEFKQVKGKWKGQESILGKTLGFDSEQKATASFTANFTKKNLSFEISIDLTQIVDDYAQAVGATQDDIWSVIKAEFSQESSIVEDGMKMELSLSKKAPYCLILKASAPMTNSAADFEGLYINSSKTKLKMGGFILNEELGTEVILER